MKPKIKMINGYVLIKDKPIEETKDEAETKKTVVKKKVQVHRDE